MPDEEDEEEVPLEGGNITGGVVRIGDTVRRPQSPGSGLAHAVLRHLEDVGFAHSPRLLGIDDQGREILSFAPGHTIWPHESELLTDGRALEPIGALVRSFHDAMAGFPSGVDDGSIVIHGDLAPWNVVVGVGGRLTLIDWDTVAQGHVRTELAYVLHTFVPLWPDTPFADDDAEVVRRIERFGAAYGADASLIDDALRAAPDRARGLADETERRAVAGEAAFRALVDDGHPQVWRAAAEHMAERLPRWLDRR